MRSDYEVSLTRKDGSLRVFHIYGRPTPNHSDVIRLPVEGRLIKARIGATGTDGN
jgi:hypothetical protein